MTERFTKTVDIKAVDRDARTATGAVLVPNELDHQEDFLRPDAVRNFQTDGPDTGVMHAAFPDDAADLVRNEVITQAETIGDEKFPPGTWVATRKYEDDDLWQLVDDGVLQGFSIGGEITRAVDHDKLPRDVRVPEDVEHEQGGTELITGTVDEVSDVDIPAVPRARYKGQDIGKSVLDEVEDKAEFVELMTDQRGHSESDAKQLYDYLTDVRDKGVAVGKPFSGPDGQGPFNDINDCVASLTADGDLSMEEARAVCATWEDADKVEINGTEVDLSPPEAVVNAAEAALQAKREDYPDELGDCGSGVGEDRAERIINDNLRPEDFAGGDNTAIPDYLDSHSEDVEGISDPPTDWGEETWTDGCGPVQYALWGGTATGTGLEWANNTEQAVLDAMEETESNMTDDSDSGDSIDASTKLDVIKSWLGAGTDDAVSPEGGQAEEPGKASDDEDDDEEDEDDDEEMEDDKANTDTMTDDTESETPEWAKSLTDDVEQISDRVDKLDSEDGDEDTEKAIDDAPEWAQSLAEKVDTLDDRVDTIATQSGHSDQLDGTQKDADNEADGEVDAYKAALVGAPTGGE